MPAARLATLPFELTTDHQVIAGGTVTNTEERRHGVLRLESELLVVQWRVEREISRIGSEIRTDTERDGMRESDLLAFDALADSDGFAFAHPAELVLPVRATDDALAREFASEMELAIAELALAAAERSADGTLPFPASRHAALPDGKTARE